MKHLTFLILVILMSNCKLVKKIDIDNFSNVITKSKAKIVIKDSQKVGNMYFYKGHKKRFSNWKSCFYSSNKYILNETVKVSTNKNMIFLLDEYPRPIVAPREIFAGTKVTPYK